MFQFRAFLTIHSSNMFTRAASENNWGWFMFAFGLYEGPSVGSSRPAETIFPQVQEQNYCGKAEW